MQRQFFVDFDGTVTTEDTVVAMVQRFAREGWQEINRKWEKKELSTEECARSILKLMDADVAELRRLMDSIALDPYFPAFLALCQQQGDQVYILSDGYDFNIKNILSRYNIDVPFYCNKLIYTDHFDIECLYNNPDCGSCGTCKTALMRQLTQKGCQTIYIGDGYSDICPAQNADMVWAKNSLLDYCRQQGIKAVAFDNFADIIKWLQKNS